jgi:uncharacterized protein
VPELRAFPPPELDRDAVRAAARLTRLVFSRDDPYCFGSADRIYAVLGLDADEVANGGHLNVDAGYGPWPAPLAWCVDETTRLTANTARV